MTFHEVCHGLTAYALGDDTAKRAGRLTLNPIRHVDVMGLLMMVVFHVGWAKPVPVNMYKFKNPKQGMAITALAGPVSNFLLAVVFLFLYGVCYWPLRGSDVGSYLLQMLDLGAYISLGLGLFNLIPVPPLDGSKVLFAVIPQDAYRRLMRYERYGSIVMILLVWSGVLGRPLSSAIQSVFSFLWPVAQWASGLTHALVG